MKIAFTSSTGEMIDQHFGQTESFLIWEVGPDEAHYLETLKVGAHGGDEDEGKGGVNQSRSPTVTTV